MSQKFQPGDIAIYVSKNPSSRYNLKKVKIQYFIKGYTPNRWSVEWLDVNGTVAYSGEDEDDLVPESIFESPLYKALE